MCGYNVVFSAIIVVCVSDVLHCCVSSIRVELNYKPCSCVKYDLQCTQHSQILTQVCWDASDFSSC